MAKTFSAQVEERVRTYKKRMDLTFRIATQYLFSEAQRPKAKGGRLPVLTGFLRNSFVTSLNGTTALTGAEAFHAVIAGANYGDTIRGGWTAAYARRREYGFIGTDSMGRQYNEQGDGFARGALEQWQDFVDKGAREALAALP